MTDPQQLALRYLTVWNATEPEALRSAVAEVFTEEARYVDPLVDVRGRDAIAATVSAAHEQFPGWTFRLAGSAEGHHDQVRFSWELGPDGGPAPVAGSDVVELDAAGRITSVSGFLDRVPG